MRTLDIGKLNKRITFMRLKDQTDEFGQSKHVLSDIKTVWASFYPVRGTEFYELQKVQSRVTHKCYIRYAPEIDSNCLVRYAGQVYEITSMIDIDAEHKLLELYCQLYTNKEQRYEWIGFDD